MFLQVILVCIRPNTRLLLTHSVSASPANLPLLTWQFVVIQLNDSSHVIDPVLAFARDSTIHFYHVIIPFNFFSPLHSVQLLCNNVSLLAVNT